MVGAQIIPDLSTPRCVRCTLAAARLRLRCRAAVHTSLSGCGVRFTRIVSKANCVTFCYDLAIHTIHVEEHLPSRGGNEPQLR
jgi:hypothetical protein